MAIESLNEELRSNPSLVDFADTNALATSFLETKSLVGNSIRIPGEDAGDDQRAEFAQKLVASAPNLMMKPDFDNEVQSKEFYRTVGMPEKPEGYKEVKFEDIPEGVTVDASQIEAFRTMAHEAGLSNAQYQQVVTNYVKGTMGVAAEGIKTASEAQAALKTEWGLAYDERMTQVGSILESTKAPESVMEAFKGKTLDPDVARWAMNLHEQIGTEGGNLVNQSGAPQSQLTPMDAKEKISEIMNNKAHAYWNPQDPGNKDALLRMVDLQTQANPGINTDPNYFRAGARSS